MSFGVQHIPDSSTGAGIAFDQPVERSGWLGRSEQQVVSKVRQFPGVAVGAALATGVMLGWLIKRL